MRTVLKRGGALATLLLLVPTVAIAACGSSAAPSATATGAVKPGVVEVVAVEDFWGSLARQVGGTEADVTSLIDDPAVDPHDYEATAADGAAVADADLLIVNGIGYDSWVDKLVAANPSSRRIVLDVGDLVGRKAGANPHVWYSPDAVVRVVHQLAADLARLQPAGAAAIHQREQDLIDHGLAGYLGVVADIRKRFAGTPIGASESVFSDMAAALGLVVLTPDRFLDAIAEGSDPTPKDKATVDAQIEQRQVAVFVYNSQNSTPDVRALLGKARAEHIPTPTVTESLEPQGASFQDWQVTQLHQLAQALTTATGR